MQRAKTKLTKEKHGLGILALRNSFYNLLVQALAGNSNHALGLSHSTQLFLMLITLRDTGSKRRALLKIVKILCSPVSRFQPLFEPWNPPSIQPLTRKRELWVGRFYGDLISIHHLSSTESPGCT